MFNIGPQELLVVLIVALIIVGPKRLPELGRTIGRGLNEFRKIQDEVKDMVKFDLGADPVEADEPIPSVPSEHSDLNDLQGDDPDDESPDREEHDERDDGMTHSERVIAAMPDDEEDGAAVEPDAPEDVVTPSSAPDEPPAVTAE